MVRLAIRLVVYLVVLAVLAFGIGMLFFKVRTAPDDSMAPNLLAGDKFLLCYRCSIEKGDAVLCDHPDPARKGVQILGRVVGMEEDTVQIRRGLLRVNDSDKHISASSTLYQYFLGPDRKIKSNQYLVWDHASLFGEQVPVLYPKDANGLMPDHTPERVKKGHYFLIGDHRSLTLGWSVNGQIMPGGGCNSSFCYGQVPVNSCHGVVFFVYSAVDRGLDGAPSRRRMTFMP